jgi:DNA-binding CsgD family transcriptional regulator
VDEVYWPDGIEQAVASAVTAVDSGIPTVLDIEGYGGYGKTRLARHVARRFPTERILWATAHGESSAQPLGLLAQLGVEGMRATDPLSAARALGARLDALSADGPVLVVLDDLHQADPESIDAIGVLMERMAGDRVLIVAAHRPVGEAHLRWRDHLEHVDAVVPVVLDGLDLESTLRLLRTGDAHASRDLAERLRVHTGGNPLFLRSLLHEHPVAVLEALAARDELPPTAALAVTMRDRLAQLDPVAVAVLSALAVLGDEGGELHTVAAVAGVGDVEAALALLRTERLVEIDRARQLPRARIFHGVITAAVYENVPASTRARMHGAAAARLTDPGARLRHRIRAARGIDDGLALDAEAYAHDLHDAGRYREAALFLRLAAQLSAAPEDARRRTLAADFESVLVFDLHELSVSGDALSAEPDALLVVGARLAVEKRFVAASDVLGRLGPDELASLPPRGAYRALVLRAWSVVGAGRSPRAALDDLDAAAATGDDDPAMRGYLALAAGQARQLAGKSEGRVPLTVTSLMSSDRARLATTAEGTMELAWRGSVMSLTGVPEVAIGDLSVVTSRFSEGLIDFSDGMFHALQGFAHFQNGQWARASIMFDLMATRRLRRPAPLSSSIRPLAAVIAGDADDARRMLAVARAARVDGPHPAAIHAGDTVDVLTLFFVGTPAEQAAWLPGRRQDLGEPADWLGAQLPHLFYVAHAIGSQWARECERASWWIGALRRMTHTAWTDAAATWLEHRDEPRDEVRGEGLRRLAGTGIPGIPVLDAMMRVDLARDASARDAPDAAERRAEAAAVLRGLGAGALVGTLLPPAQEPDTAEDDGPLATLSAREREVASLLLEGLSYAQIASELFITRSTVSFHLSRIYAKTGVTTRHEFVRLLRDR